MTHRLRRLWHTVWLGPTVIAFAALLAGASDTTPKQFDGEMHAPPPRRSPTAHGAGGVDGIINGKFGFHTDNEANPWWQVDLGTAQRLDRAVLFNRTDCAAERAKTVTVLLSDDGAAWRVAYRHDGTVFGGQGQGEPLTVDLAGQSARFVRLQLREATWFHLDEAQVFAVDQPERNIALRRPTKISSLYGSAAQPATAELDLAVQRQALRLAIDDLIATFGDRYPDGAAYLKRLDALEGGDDAAALAALRRAALLANPLLDFQKLLIVKRDAKSPRLGLVANHQGNCKLPRQGFNDELAMLTDVRRGGDAAAWRTVVKPEPGTYIGEVDLHFDADRVLYSAYDAQRRWRIFELALGGGAPRKITQIEEPDVDNYDACYLPDGGVMFTSTATYVGVPCVFGSCYVPNLYRADQTGAIRRLTFDQDHNWCPTVLPNGRVLYLRWEYGDLPHSNSRILFSMNPDGTNQMEYYGSNSYFPTSFFYARPLPDDTGRVVGIATGHHGTARSGRLLVLDPAIGRQEAGGVVAEIGRRGERVESLVRDRLVDGVWPQYLHPFPLSEKYFLVSAKPTPQSHWGVYLVDVFDNRVLIAEQPGYALFEPVPVQQASTPPALASRVDEQASDARVYLVDIYRGGGLAGVPRGEVKQLRLYSYYYSSRDMGGLLGSIGMDGPWDIRRVLGTVPVERDGSAYFTVPANTPIAVQPLDAEGKALQQMRSWFVGMPGEVVGCVGCHEKQNDATPNAHALAMRRTPSSIDPWRGPARGFSFAREVQPVLDRHCLGCHDGADHAAEPDLRGDVMITDWSSQISGNVGKRCGGKFSVAYANLHRYVRRMGIESDLHMLPPMDFHADTTELVQLLQAGHRGVELDGESWDRLITWIDMNAPYHGTWAELLGGKTVEPIVTRRRELEQRYGGIDVDHELIVEPAPLRKIDQKPAATPAAEREPVAAPFTPLPDGAERPTLAIDLGDGVTMTLVRLGTTPTGEAMWMGACEVSNAQFARFDPAHDSRRESRHGYQFGRLGYPLNEPQQPVVRVSWDQATAFCDWLSRRTGRTVTLPTAAQWEQACRAGATTPMWYGDLDTDFAAYANLGDKRLKEYAACTATGHYSSTRVLPNPNRYDDWVPKDERFDDGHFLAAPIGSYKANAYGLHDMHGNVWEWTRTDAAPLRGVATTATPRKVVCGGSWYDRPKRAAADYRLSYRPYHGVFNVGFRVIMIAEAGQAGE